MTPEERIAELEAENAGLREQMTGLLAQVQELEARLAKLGLTFCDPFGWRHATILRLLRKSG